MGRTKAAKQAMLTSYLQNRTNAMHMWEGEVTRAESNLARAQVLQEDAIKLCLSRDLSVADIARITGRTQAGIRAFAAEED